MPVKNKGQEQWTAAQFQEHFKKTHSAREQGTRMKYGNVKQKIDGYTFDSKKEAKYYGILKLRVRAGNILKFEVHVAYPLIVNGHLIARYIADFVLYNWDGSTTVVDVKSAATEGLAVFKMKKALMLALHKINVQIA
jgi:hypothetical protein